MTSPSSPVQKLASLPDSAPLASVDVAPPSPAAGTAPEALTARAENQPAPPTRNSTGAESQTVRVAKLISSTRPVYPAMAKESKIQGHVVINVSIGEQGNVV